jgi:HAD superfamily hydrolase (TIGR01509 family)
MSKPTAVLFDMDGTLINSIPAWRITDREVFARYGHELTEEAINSGLHHLHGSLEGVARFRRHLVETSGAAVTVEQFSRDSDENMARYLRNGIAWMPGAQELLRDVYAQDVPAALVTTSPRVVVDAWLDTHADGMFKAAVAGDEVTRGKPYPEPYLRAAELLEVDPARCIAVEDTPGGYASAVAAGCRTVLVAPERAPGARWVASLEGLGLAELTVVAWGPV